MNESDRDTTEMSRRSFITNSIAATGAMIGAGSFLSSSVLARSSNPTEPAELFELANLPYAYDALEPVVDQRTMEIHYGKHHAGYVRKLNAALDGHKDLQAMSLEDLLSNGASIVPEDVRQAVINSGGGHANHSLFWTVLGPKGKVAAAPKGSLADAIKAGFGSLDSLKETLVEAGSKRFGSGWAWLVKSGGKLEVYSTANQDSPLMQGHTPIFGIDVWEHAYYLNYQNRRGDYLKAIFDIVNWDEVGRRFAS